MCTKIVQQSCQTSFDVRQNTDNDRIGCASGEKYDKVTWDTLTRYSYITLTEIRIHIVCRQPLDEPTTMQDNTLCIICCGLQWYTF